MRPGDILAPLWTDLKAGFAMLTRLPVRRGTSAEPADLARAGRIMPVVGVAVGLAGAAAYGLAHGVGLPPWLAALLAVAATILVTGALHEDGLADVADGFGGAFARERKLAIMRDSRIGSYGVIALILSIGLRTAALAALASPEAMAAVLVAAHGLSRGLLAPTMLLLTPARDEGLAAAAGRPGHADALTALALGLVVAVLATGVVFGLGLGLAALAGGALVALIALRQIGGYSGDVLGAVQQLAEIAVLLAAAAVLA